MARFRCAFSLALALVVGIFPSARLTAQVGTGTISGVVTDSSGAVLPGATLTITNSETGVVTSVTANDQGHYIAPDLIVGNYELKGGKKGFQTQVFKQIRLTVGADVVVDCKLPVGQETTTITVESDVSQVDTTTSEISAQIGRDQMANLPLNGRNFEQLILLAPGVQSVTTGTQNSFYGRAPSYSIAGSRPEGQELLLDGATIQGFWGHGAGNSIIGTSLGVEGIGEFQILTNSYSARFGGSGSVLNATTRSGTNALHGSLYDFLRNSVFDSRNYFNQTPLPQDPFRQNQFGGTLGGPIVKDKMFFFGNYEGIRRLLGETVIGFVPNDNTRQGIVPCSYAPDLTCNPNGTATVPVNSASQAILNLYPAVSPSAGIPGTPAASVTLSGTQPANEDYVNVRWDYHLSERDSVFARYIIDNGSLTEPFASALGLYPEQSLGRNQYLTLGYTKVISSALVNDARFSFVRTNMRAFTNVSNPPLQFFSFYGENRQDGDVNVPGFSPIGPSNFTPDYEIQNTFAVSDGMFWIHGKHSFEIGLEFRRLQSPLTNGFFDDQGWSFPNVESFLEGQSVSPTDPPITLLGALPGKANSTRSFREWDLFPYIQDTWRATRTLTLNLGIRYDFISNPTEIHNELCAFIAPSNPSTTACTPVSHVFPSNPSRHSLDPRIGVAWDLFGDQRTSIRAGAGVFHDPIQVRNYHPAYLFAGPFQTAVSVCVFGGPPCSYPVPFQGITVPTPTIGEALEYNPGTTPFILQYNFGIQRELGRNTVLSVSYVGSHGYNLLVQNDTNPPIPAIVDGQPNFLNAPRNNPNLGAIAFNVPDGSSRYDSLQLYLTRNVSRTVQFQAAYTYSKCIDYGSISYGLEASNSDQQAQSDPYNLAVDKGPCDFDIKHNFTGSATYSVPLQGNRVIEGWQISTIISVHSGSPFSVQDGFDQVGLNDPAGQPGERPDLVPGRSSNPILGLVNEWYDPSAFALQGAGFLGDLGRNTLVGPKFADFDLSLAKITRIKENMSVEFRAEGFNLLNHPTFGLPGQALFSGIDQNGNGIPSPTAGQITSTVGTARELQFALKFRF
jgi:Carboxypeptidase regulatory-like domain/TonB-dependent Receptor Plug Domain